MTILSGKGWLILMDLDTPQIFPEKQNIWLKDCAIQMLQKDSKHAMHLNTILSPKSLTNLYLKPNMNRLERGF